MDRRSFLCGSASLAALTAVPLPVLASAQSQSPAPSNSLALDNGWEFYRGPLDGRHQVWHSEEIVTWEKVSLPHCFNHYDACDPDTPAYRGQGWYRTKLAIANPYAHGRTLLHLEGAGQQAEVWVAGSRIVEHVGGYDEWMVDLTEHTLTLKPNEPLELAILCDNGRNIERMPSDQSDFTLYGGLYRPVHLVYVPAISLEAVHTHIAFEPHDPIKLAVATVSVTARLYTPQPIADDLILEITVHDPSGRLLHAKQLTRPAWTGEVEIDSLPLQGPRLWSPDEPNLYRCTVTLRHAGDEATATHRFGIRHTRWEEHGPFFLNGKRMLLKGTQRHEDHAGYAAAMPAALIREEMQRIKDMGANIVRLGHYQQRSLVLDLCDELGLFVWEEIPWCRSGVVSETFAAMGKRTLRALIDQHRNHPSVLIWGLGNEDDWPTEINLADRDAMRRLMTELRDIAHAEDPTRMTGYRRGDFARDIVDVYSPSIWAGWYSGVYTGYADALEKARPTVPHLLHVEWGADSHAGRFEEESEGPHTPKPNRGAKDGIWSETYACDLFEWYLRTIDNTPWLTGALQWCFKDFTTPLRVENPVPRVNQKGVLTRDMRPKESYFVFQSWWSTKPMLRLFGHDWPVRWGSEGQARLARVYSNCAEVELFLNGVTQGKRRRNPNDFPCAGLRWNTVFRPGHNELRAVARTPAGQELTDTLTFRYETRSWGKPSSLALKLFSLSRGLMTVEAELLDAAGVRCLDARTQVRFSLAGTGRLVDNLGTPTGSRVVQLYNGRAQISIASPGPAVVAVGADGLAPAFLNFPGGINAS